MTEWDLINDDDPTLRYDNQDRDVSVYATRVSTANGVVWSCSLYQREIAYGKRRVELATLESDVVARDDIAIVRVGITANLESIFTGWHSDVFRIAIGQAVENSIPSRGERHVDGRCVRRRVEQSDPRHPVVRHDRFVCEDEWLEGLIGHIAQLAGRGDGIGGLL